MVRESPPELNHQRLNVAVSFFTPQLLQALKPFVCGLVQEAARQYGPPRRWLWPGCGLDARRRPLCRRWWGGRSRRRILPFPGIDRHPVPR
jgi:hypothetical protein